ncbi:MAG: NAD(P)-binding domain-containing protein [Bacteroidales bacterium]|nr:NAD(P)-binding domain-containing protein [Bacteroidales bacterium]
MKTQHLGFIGGGRVTRILLQAFQNKKIEFDSITVYEPDNETAAGLKKRFPEITSSATTQEAAGQDIVFLAVHPPVMMETLGNIKNAVSEDNVIISLAPKIPIAKMEEMLPARRIVRMIPNATSFINKGYNPVTFNNAFSQEEKKVLMKMLKKAGKTMEVEEKMLEGYAIVSAMLPTYFWFQWKKMEEIAVKTGFSEAEAKKVIGDTLKRSLKLYYKSELSPVEVIDLIPVKPIGEHEAEIEQILETKLLGLYEKIKP